MDGVLSRIPGLAGYLAGQQNDQALQMGSLQQLGALQGVLGAEQLQRQKEAALVREQAYRTALNAAKTPDEQAAIAAQFGDPKDVLAHADRLTTAANTKELALARLKQTATQMDQTFQIRSQTARTAAEKAAVDREWKQFRSDVDRERLKYDTGASVPAFALPPMPNADAPQPAQIDAAPGISVVGSTPTADLNLSGFSPGVLSRYASADPVLAKALSEAGVLSSQPAPMVQRPAIAPTPEAPPIATAPAQPNNLDARDLGAMSRGPVMGTTPVSAPPLAPLAAPVQPVAPAPSGLPKMPPEIQALPKKQQDAWMAKQATGESSVLSPEALGPMAWEKLLYGTNPPGMGNSSAAQRKQVNEERARLGKSLGLSDMEMAMLPQDNKVKMKAVDKLTTWGAFVDKAADQLVPSIDLAISYAKGLDQSTLQTLNRAILAGKTEFNDPKANAYAVAVNTVRREYGRLMSGPTSNAMLPVEAMKGADKLISGALDVPAWEEVKSVILKDAAFTKDSVKKQIDTLRGSISNPRGASDATPNDIAKVVRAAGETYDPSKYDYRIAPDGSVQRKAK